MLFLGYFICCAAVTVFGFFVSCELFPRQMQTLISNPYTSQMAWNLGTEAFNFQLINALLFHQHPISFCLHAITLFFDCILWMLVSAYFAFMVSDSPTLIVNSVFLVIAALGVQTYWNSKSMTLSAMVMICNLSCFFVFGPPLLLMIEQWQESIVDSSHELDETIIVIETGFHPLILKKSIFFGVVVSIFITAMVRSGSHSLEVVPPGVLGRKMTEPFRGRTDADTLSSLDRAFIRMRKYVTSKRYASMLIEALATAGTFWIGVIAELWAGLPYRLWPVFLYMLIAPRTIPASTSPETPFSLPQAKCEAQKVYHKGWANSHWVKVFQIDR